jgi:hypothetical protein
MILKINLKNKKNYFKVFINKIHFKKLKYIEGYKYIACAYFYMNSKSFDTSLYLTVFVVCT